MPSPGIASTLIVGTGHLLSEGGTGSKLGGGGLRKISRARGGSTKKLGSNPLQGWGFTKKNLLFFNFDPVTLADNKCQVPKL